MTYTATWNAAFSKPLLNQTIAIIQRDQISAIALVNPALAPINEFHKGPAVRTAFPWLILSADQIEFDVSSPWTRSWSSALTLALETGQYDQEMAQDNAQDYTRALDMILTTASGADWTTALPIVHETIPAGITTPPAAGSVKSIFVKSHRYSLVTRAGIDVPVMQAMLTVIFKSQET
ncbi:MAG: hypothetical protein ACRD1I_00050 [Terriglobia bacterium]